MNPGICACGCGQRTRLAPGTDSSRGWVKGEPIRYIRGHGNRARPTQTLAERFWANVERGAGCWLWTGRVHRGYGAFDMPVEGVTRWRPHRAHRVAWEIGNGPIPAGIFVCHHCDNPRCVRPSHLFLGTHSDNMEDALGKGRIPRKLTAEQVAMMRDLHGRGSRTVASLARDFGVCHSTARKIIRGEKWR